jgi:AraC-like DNA-binding protein
VSRRAEVKDQVIDFLAKRPGQWYSYTELSQRLHVSRRRLVIYMKDARETGLIEDQRTFKNVILFRIPSKNVGIHV